MGQIGIWAFIIYGMIQSNTSDSNSGTYTTAIEGGSFNGTFSVVLGSLSITGGYFTSDPSTYVTDNTYAVFGNDDATYLYTVAEADGAVAQIGSVNYKTLSEAIAAANAATEATTITLLSSVSLDSSLIINNTSYAVTLDLNGNNITRGATTTAYLIGVASGADLTVQDTSSGGSGTIDATFTVDGTTYLSYPILTNGAVTVASGTLAGSYGTYVYGDNASLTVNGGTVSGTAYGVYLASGTTTVDGGTVTASAGYGIYVYGGVTEVKSGTVSGYQRGISVAASATSSTVTVSGGKVEGSTYGIAQFAGEVIVSGGEVTSTGNIAITAFGEKLTVSGGTVSGGVRGIEMTTGITCITGGTVTGGNYGLIQFGGTTTVSGGTVSGFYAGAYVTGSSTKLTVSDTAEVKSTVTSSETTNYASTSAITILYGAEVTINGGTVTGGYCGVGIFAGNSADDMSTLIVNGGSISAFGFGVSTNGSNSYDYIEINGGSISGDGTGMYLPAMNSSTVITGGTITGEAAGIEIRAGSLTVSGGTITGTGTPNSFKFNGSGTTVVGAGIAISQHTTNQEIDVTVTGGTISGYYGIFEVNTNANNTSDVNLIIKEADDGTCATIKSTDTSEGIGEAIYSVSVSGANVEDASGYYQNGNTTFSISGGSYSTVLDPEYCAEGYAPETTYNETTELYGVTTAKVKGLDRDGEYVAGYASLEAAIANTSTSVVTIQLVANCEVSGSAEATKSMTIDLAGYDLTIKSDATLTVNGDNVEVVIIDSQSAGKVYNYGTIVVTNGTLDIRDLGYTTDTDGNGLYGQTNGKISLGASGVFIVPDVWNDLWIDSMGENWTPNWPSATGSNGIFSEVGAGATVYSFGKGWKCTTEFTGSYDSSTIYWEVSGTYLVEYFKTERGGDGIVEATASTWKYPEADEDSNLIFAGWYKDASYAETYTDTTGVAYAKFVTLCEDWSTGDEHEAAVINFLGGSLRMDYTTEGEDGSTGTGYSKTSLRFGYDIIIPDGCERVSWGWEWYIEGVGKVVSVDGVNLTVLSDKYADNKIGTSDMFCGNLVITGIPYN